VEKAREEEEEEEEDEEKEKRKKKQGWMKRKTRVKYGHKQRACL
jgi:hypothetical protein